LGLGAGFTDPKMIEMIPFLGNEYVNLVLNFMLTIGLFAFNNLGALFAMAIPLGLLKKEKEFGAFSGLVGFIAMHIGTNFYLTRADLLVPAEQMSTNGQAIIMGIQTYNTSALGGIVAGLFVHAINDEVRNFNIPESSGIYSGPILVLRVSLI
ncbi:PTS transporter subunit EIIC, partial [Clostridioides difficile]|uniref:PTS transporter subunit EIIC n=1 Tax=Clostridioides difficile TaxID=1496 RepID=UPI001595F156